MKTRKYQSDEERMILTALIVHDSVLERIYRHFGGNGTHPFRSKWSNLIAGWCFKYFSKYQKAPRRAIESIFLHYAKSSSDTEAVGLVEKFLEGLDSDYRALAKGMNEDYLVDHASVYFDKIRLSHLADDLQAALEREDVDEARTLQSAYERIDLTSNNWKTFDLDTVKGAFRKRADKERLIEFPGALGNFLSPYLRRGDFVAWAGPDKRGKSYWLQEIVWQALRQRRKVLYYVLGDMELDEVYQRLCVRMTRHPLVECEVSIPKRIIPRGADDVDITYRERGPRRAVTLKDVAAAREKLLLRTASKGINLKVRCEGGSIISAGEIESDVARFAKQGWVPDAVVIDYADLLLAEPHTKHLDFRHQNNATWMVLRRIALKFHCLVTTATQTAATAYGAWVIRKKDFSEDKRKNAHVTGMVGINQTDGEKERGIYRLNWVVLRGGRWSESQVIWTAGDLAVACPCIVSSERIRNSD